MDKKSKLYIALIAFAYFLMELIKEYRAVYGLSVPSILNWIPLCIAAFVVLDAVCEITNRK